MEWTTKQFPGASQISAINSKIDDLGCYKCINHQMISRAKPCLFGIYRGIMLQQIYTRGLFSSYSIGIHLNQPGFNGSCRKRRVGRSFAACYLLPWMTWGPVRGISLKLQVTTRGKGNNKLCQGKRMGVYTPNVRVLPMVFSWCSLQHFLGIINP